jgi:ribosome-associated protein
MYGKGRHAPTVRDGTEYRDAERSVGVVEIRVVDLVTDGGLTVPEAALSWKFSRSSGPGGQHVNKTESRVELTCELADVELPDHLRDRLISALGTTVRLTADGHRSQLRNRTDALARLASMLDQAAIPPQVRRKTRPSRGAKERRLEGKRQVAERKSGRSWKPDGG